MDVGDFIRRWAGSSGAERREQGFVPRPLRCSRRASPRRGVEEVLQGFAAFGLAVTFKMDGVTRWRAARRLAA